MERDEALWRETRLIRNLLNNSLARLGSTSMPYPTNGLTRIDRGDPTAFDFGLGTGLTADSTWRDLDLSSIVTDDNAVLVELYAQFVDGVANATIYLRKNGNANAVNVDVASVQVANVYNFLQAKIAVDTSRIVEYQITTGMDTCNLVVRGWWRPAS